MCYSVQSMDDLQSYASPHAPQCGSTNFALHSRRVIMIDFVCQCVSVCVSLSISIAHSLFLSMGHNKLLAIAAIALSYEFLD